MSTLDDALSSPSPIFDQPELYVEWKETLTGEEAGNENVREIGDTVGTQYSASQSLDDGLPDAVTMTTSNDAAGKLVSSLGGRPGLDFDSWIASTSTSGTIAGPTTSLTFTLPGSSWGAYVYLFVTVPSTTVTIDNGTHEGTPAAWTFLRKQSSATTTVWVFYRKWVPAATIYGLTSSASLSNVSYVAVSVRAVDPIGNELRWRVNAQQSIAAGGSATVHTQPSITTTSARAVLFAVWSSPGSATWTPNIDTTMATVTNAGTAMAVSRAGLYSQETTRANMAATRSVASADVAMMVFAIEPWERPAMRPTEYWSPFYPDSPVYGFDRDTAPTTMKFKTITEDGPQSTTIFTGQMDDISLGSGGEVQLSASSGVRITLNKSINLPTVYGRREGATVDWLVAWIMARGDRFIGPAPGPHARWWLPMYGSMHAALGAEEKGYGYALRFDPSGGPYQYSYPTAIDGPFHLAMFAKHTATETFEVGNNGVDLYKSREMWPWVLEQYATTDLWKDLMSPANNTGRFSFWVRADATYAGTPTGVPAGNRYLAYFYVQANRDPAMLARVSAYIDTDRGLYVSMGSDVGGTTTVAFTGSFTLPTDGQWHFYSIAWNWATGTVRARRNSIVGSSSAPGTNGNNDMTNWKHNTDANLYSKGGTITTLCKFHLPVSDVILDTGPEVFASDSDLWPTAVWPSFTATARPTYATIEGVFNDEPVNAWDTLASLARSTLSAYRANEADETEFLPVSYFGESTQMTPAYTVDTESNAQNLQIIADPSKSRNVVTVKFQDQRVDSALSSCLSLTTSLEIPAGITTFTFTLDEQIAELHGAGNPSILFGGNWLLTNLTAAQITTGWSAVPNDKHFMSVNSAEDGSGNVQDLNSVWGQIMSATSTTVTIRFTNNTTKTMYLANNNQSTGGTPQVPYLRILGYVVRFADAYVTQRDSGLLGYRRERAMETELEWVTDRTRATTVAGWLVSMLARPRGQITAIIQGDPRRIPGEMVTVSDPFNTHANGNWRVLSVDHNIDGASFTQTVQLVETLPIAYWDQSNWDQAVWGE